MKFHKRIHGERYPKEYPRKLDASVREWAKKQRFPLYQEVKLVSAFEDDGVRHVITAMPMDVWKERDHKVKKGEKSLFWLGNLPWFTNRQVEYIDGFAFWDDKPKYSGYSLGEIEAGGYGTEWDYEAGDGNGGPFF